MGDMNKTRAYTQQAAFWVGTSIKRASHQYRKTNPLPYVASKLILKRNLINARESFKQIINKKDYLKKMKQHLK